MSTRTSAVLLVIVGGLAAGSVVLALQGVSIMWAVAVAMVVVALAVVRRLRGEVRRSIDSRSWRGWATTVGTFLVMAFLLGLAAGRDVAESAGLSIALAVGLGLALAVFSQVRLESDD